MKKFALLLGFIVSLLLSLGCCSGITRVNSPPTDLIPHLKNSTVTLVQQQDDGIYMPFCGAVWVNKEYLVTAKHCVENDDEEVEIGNTLKFQIYKEFDNHYPFSKNDKVYIAEIVAEGADNEDVALLRSLDNVEHGIATVATYTPRDGQTIHHIGHPRGLQFTYMKCVMAEERIYYTYGYNRHVIHVVGFIWFGSSGGGGFDDQGNLVGIASMINKAPGQSIFIHPKVIRSLLDDNRIEYYVLN